MIGAEKRRNRKMHKWNNMMTRRIETCRILKQDMIEVMCLDLIVTVAVRTGGEKYYRYRFETRTVDDDISKTEQS